MSESIHTEILPAPPGKVLAPPPTPPAPPVHQPSAVKEFLFRYVPALDSLRTYSLTSLRADFLAGLTVAAVAVPQAMAYASIAGLPPQYGLYTAIIMTTVGALLDSSKQLINGPTNAISIAVLSAIAFVPAEDKLSAAILLAFMVGAVQTGITLLRLGDLSRYISHSVIVGFTVGAAVLLVLDQLKNLFGLAAVGGPHDHFLKRFWLTMREIDQTNLWTLAIGLSTIAVVLGLRWLGNRLGTRLPELLLAVALMALLVGVGSLGEQGVQVIGGIPPALPSFDWPDFDWGYMRNLGSSALAIAVLGLLEAIAMAKAIAAKTGQKLDINQQCLSEGLANLSGSFFQCFPGSGSLTRSAINVQAGAVSQWSGVISALAVAGTVLVLAPYAYYIPRAALAGILLVSAWQLVDRRQLRYHMKATRFDAGIVAVTAISAVAVSVEFCILIGVFLSFILFVPRAARLHLTELTVTPERVLRERLPSDPPCNRLLVYSLEGELFFGSAADLDKHFDAMAERVKNGARVIVLRLKRVRNPDAVCLELLERFIKSMEQRGVTVLLCGVRNDLAKVFRACGLTARLGPNHIYREVPGTVSSTLDAVRQAYELLKEDLCATCPRRGEMGAKEVLYYMI